jgi:hypothetical protein
MAIVQLEGLGKLKKFHLIGTRTSDIPACSIVRQPTTLPVSPAFALNVCLYSLLSFSCYSEYF